MTPAADEAVNGDRRRLCALATAAPLLLLGLGSTATAAETACFNPQALPASQKRMRATLGFKPLSPDPKRKCGSCTFFAPSGGGCGKCALLSGGPVAAASVCDSWAAKG